MNLRILAGLTLVGIACAVKAQDLHAWHVYQKEEAARQLSLQKQNAAWRDGFDFANNDFHIKLAHYEELKELFKK
jgi:tRNA1(Val) A37 N6-methylase TrmN6